MDSGRIPKWLFSNPFASFSHFSSSKLRSRRSSTRRILYYVYESSVRPTEPYPRSSPNYAHRVNTDASSPLLVPTSVYVLDLHSPLFSTDFAAVFAMIQLIGLAGKYRDSRVGTSADGSRMISHGPELDPQHVGELQRRRKDFADTGIPQGRQGIHRRRLQPNRLQG